MFQVYVTYISKINNENNEAVHICQVREVRKEKTRYSGELSGIRAGVKKSIKLK